MFFCLDIKRWVGFLICLYKWVDFDCCIGCVRLMNLFWFRIWMCLKWCYVSLGLNWIFYEVWNFFFVYGLSEDCSLEGNWECE